MGGMAAAVFGNKLTECVCVFWRRPLLEAPEMCSLMMVLLTRLR